MGKGEGGGSVIQDQEPLTMMMTSPSSMIDISSLLPTTSCKKENEHWVKGGGGEFG